MTDEPRDLQSFLASFVEEHTLADGDNLLITVRPEDAQTLGLFFVHGICGWAKEISNAQRQITVGTDLPSDSRRVKDPLEDENQLTH